jgi:hypothetical protein
MPILLSARVPDCMEYAKELGIDINAWLQEKLVDLLFFADHLVLTDSRAILLRLGYLSSPAWRKLLTGLWPSWWTGEEPGSYSRLAGLADVGQNVEQTRRRHHRIEGGDN